MESRPRSRNCSRAFSLIELLVVVVIIGIVARFAVPAVGSLLRGSALTQAATLLTDQVSLARQHALSRNRVVEVRFYRFWDPEQAGEKATDDPASAPFRALQYLEIGEQAIPNPVGKVARFPDSMMMNPSETFSTILGTNVTTRLVKKASLDRNDPDLPRGIDKNYDYIAFRFQPDGSTSLSPTGSSTGPSSGGRWFITVHAISDLARTTGGEPPPNFATWMIDPVSGSSKVFRPGLKN